MTKIHPLLDGVHAEMLKAHMDFATRLGCSINSMSGFE
jgi:hypothetical protein